MSVINQVRWIRLAGIRGALVFKKAFLGVYIVFFSIQYSHDDPMLPFEVSFA
jgi:hypothetical protein